VTDIPCTFHKREKVAIPKIIITLVALFLCVRAGMCVCEFFVARNRAKNVLNTAVNENGKCLDNQRLVQKKVTKNTTP
jgi:hypothetical protein